MSELIIKMSEIEVRLAAGCAENTQVSALIAAFQLARDTVTLES